MLDLLKVHEATTREFARLELQQRGRDAVISHLDDWVATLDPSEAEYEHHLTEALWVRQGLNAINVDLLKRLLGAKDAGARVAATQVLRFWQDRIDDSLVLLRQQIDDPDARVRLHAVLGCGFSKSENAMMTAIGAANHPMDSGLEHVLDQTLNVFEQSEKQRNGP